MGTQKFYVKKVKNLVAEKTLKRLSGLKSEIEVPLMQIRSFNIEYKHHQVKILIIQRKSGNIHVQELTKTEEEMITLLWLTITKRYMKNKGEKDLA